MPSDQLIYHVEFVATHHFPLAMLTVVALTNVITSLACIAGHVPIR
ncbi:hypothetical protein [Veronia pacifica]|nr:hypothetical protein [Veronia pacifica]